MISEQLATLLSFSSSKLQIERFMSFFSSFKDTMNKCIAPIQYLQMKTNTWMINNQVAKYVLGKSLNE